MRIRITQNLPSRKGRFSLYDHRMMATRKFSLSSAIDEKLHSMMMDLDGIEVCRLEKSSLVIQIGEAYNWEQMEVKVLNCIKSWNDSSDELTVELVENYFTPSFPKD